MGQIDDACKEVVGKVDGAVACGAVELDSGKFLGIYNASQYAETLNEAVAEAIVEMFRGSNINRVEQLVREHRRVPEKANQHFQEVHITSENKFHFAKTIKEGRAVLLLVTKKTTNIGIGWSQLESIIPVIEPLVP